MAAGGRGVGRSVAGRAGTLIVLLLAAVLANACGAENALQQAASAPLNVLKATDVVVETNLQTIRTEVGTGVAAGQAVGGMTNGPSTGAGVISVSQSTGETVLAGYDEDSRDCLGMLMVKTAGVPVLGESSPGTYYFWLTSTTSAACDAPRFAASSGVPAGWPAGDPSSSGWPPT
jgi:hypothetical protein